jgi:hypothetical protein
MHFFRKIPIFIALMLVFIIPSFFTMSTAPQAKAAAADATRTFTFVNNTSQTIWAGALANSGLTTPGNGGWEMDPGATYTVTVADTWGGRFWGRTFCNFNGAGAGTCETGDCGGVLQCNGAGGIPPATLAEFTLGGSSNKDFYDVSFVDGYNVPMTITPVGGAQPTPGNPYWCGVAGCGVDLNANCPSALQQVDGSGRIVACKSACEAFNTDQYCCRGAYATAATCDPTQWPVDYASYFKSNCPYSYSYAYDDPTSTFTDQGANYQITFGPAGGSSGGGGSGSGTYYKLINRNSGQALDISGGSTANGGSAIQWPYSGGTNQQWQEVAVNGGYKLVNRNSGLLLDDPGFATTPGTALDQWSDTNGSNQWWNLVSTGDGYYNLVNQSSGLYADVSGASTANGASVIEWTATGGTNQQWQLLSA